MGNKAVEEFFSSLAPHWDEMECVPPKRIEALLNKVNIQPGERVLDVACGTGIITSRLASYSKLKVLGIDISPKMIEIAKSKNKGVENVEFDVMDFTESDFEHCFDVVVIYNAFPHFLDLDALQNALERALGEGGRFAILHSLSRAELDKHHSGRVSKISRVLNSPDQEANAFAKYFEIIEASESDEHYCIIGKKKVSLS